MSTHLRRSAADDTPVVEADLIAYFTDGTKPVENARVGAEFEKFALNRDTGLQIGFDDGIEARLRALADRFDWEPHEEAGRLTTLTRGRSTISIEPGGQVELSTAPALHLSELKAELDGHIAELRAVCDPARIAYCAAGVTPFSAVEQIPLNPRPRHRLMAEYLPTRCEFGLHMMKATASTQVTFDFTDEADAARKFAVALCLSPVVNAAFANAPLAAGTPTGLVSFRACIWQGMDPDRSGFLAELLDGEVSFERWTAFVLDVPLLFTEIDGKFRPAPGITFRQWMQRGIDGRYPTLHDWDIHISTVFTEARMKRFIEVRGADAGPTPLALAVPAVWKGLFYDSEALTQAANLAGQFPPTELFRLSSLAAREGLRGEYRGRTLADWCRELLDIAAPGLKRQAERTGLADESGFLDPLRAVVASGVSPGERWFHGGTVAQVLAAIEYPGG
jgi:glutamate--cysteine ligase